jgi:acetyl-CoA C-acetyltransferase
VGKLGGGLSGVEATRLGAVAIRAALERSGLEPEQADYAIMGNVLSAGLGQAPARQAAIYAGLPDTASAMAVNKVCASGMMSVMLASQMVRIGDCETVVAGGMESMSRAPHVLNGSRSGKRLGGWELSDTMIDDGLWCCFNDRPMGYLAETTAEKFGVTREMQDRFALESHRRAARAVDAEGFREEIAPVTVNGKRGHEVVGADDGPRPDSSMEALKRLKPAFPPKETVTPGNSSQISDGAAAMIVSSESRARALGLEPMARLEDYTFIAVDPGRLFEAPALAVDRLLERGGMTLSDIDLLEINEAFAAQVVANGRAVEWDWEKVNVNGGAVALGHPLGASGARILVTLLYALKQRGLSTGIAALCHGGGGAVAVRVSLV